MQAKFKASSFKVGKKRNVVVWEFQGGARVTQGGECSPLPPKCTPARTISLSNVDA